MALRGERLYRSLEDFSFHVKAQISCKWIKPADIEAMLLVSHRQFVLYKFDV